MKLHQPLDDILNQTVKIRILRCLSLRGIELTGRQIAEEVRSSPPTVHKSLKELTQEHVILARRAGRAYLFRLNQENYLVQNMLKPLFEKEKSLIKFALEEILKKIPVSIISAILYGSLAQQKETPQSDIDLLLIIKQKDKIKAEKAFDKISSDFLARYGRIISPHIITAVEFQNKYKRRIPLWVEIVKTGIVLKGDPISELLSHGS